MKWRKFNGDPIELPIYQAVENAIKRETSKGFRLDRKSTRLNSSHMSISYAVFCLKKKNDKKALISAEAEALSEQPDILQARQVLELDVRLDYVVPPRPRRPLS